MKDTTEAQAVTIESLSKRVDHGPTGSHALSGTWQAYKVSKSKIGSTITYRCTADGFSAETPLGEKFDAKFDGKFYPVEDDPGHTMVSLKLINASTVEQTGKRDGKIVSVMRLTVSPDGKSIHGVRENKEDNTTTALKCGNSHNEFSARPTPDLSRNRTCPVSAFLVTCHAAREEIIGPTIG